MYEFIENDHEQIYIPKDCFYQRYTFEYQARILQPKPGVAACICKRPYNPNDCEVGSLMHFCPRPSCRKAYHHRCLLGIGSREILTLKIPSFSGSHERSSVKVARSTREHASPLRRPSTRKAKVARAVIPPSPAPETPLLPLSPRCLRLLACSPDMDVTLDPWALILHNDGATESSSDLDVDGKKPATVRRHTETTSFESILATISPDLLTIAIQPLVRGGAFVAGGVAGNIGMVTKARRLVYAALQMGGGEEAAIPKNWMDTVFTKDRDLVGIGTKNAVVHVMFDLPPFLCPRCGSAIWWEEMVIDPSLLQRFA